MGPIFWRMKTHQWHGLIYVLSRDYNWPAILYLRYFLHFAIRHLMAEVYMYGSLFLY